MLELAIGTGRLSIPLAQRGLEVCGVDASEEMVARLRAKSGGADIPVVMGDFADVGVKGSFSLIFVAFNDRGQRVGVSAVDIGRVDFEVSRHDPANQRVDSQHVFVTEEGMKLAPVRLRYAFASELDLMARLAGLELKGRWGSWHGEPFTSRSGHHVSVYASG